jgi:prenyltransferase beta subunit
LPASKITLLMGLFILALVCSGITSEATPQAVFRVKSVVSQPMSQLNRALNWLAANQTGDGSFGQFFEDETAAAAYAFWLNDSSSAHATRAASYLAGQLESSSSWFWTGYGEADWPGNILYVLGATRQLSLISNVSAVASRLLEWQRTSGGFVGYYDFATNGNVTSSVDTDMALWGMTLAQAIPLSNQTSAVRYLLSLQNIDGSFNLTNSIPSSSIDSLGPDQASTTALSVLVLRDLSLTRNDFQISKALSFLANAESTNFGGHVYAASLSALAFMALSLPGRASDAVRFILSQQNSDGGFSDIIRSSSNSNALDTAWASIAIQLVHPAESVNLPPVAKVAVSSRTPVMGAADLFSGKGSFDSDGDALSYSWTFGDGGSATGVNATHTYLRSGNFTVTLTTVDSGSNPSALSNTVSLTISVQPETVQASSSLLLTTMELGGLVAVAVAILLSAFYVLLRRERRRNSSSNALVHD